MIIVTILLPWVAWNAERSTPPFLWTGAAVMQVARRMYRRAASITVLRVDIRSRHWNSTVCMLPFMSPIYLLFQQGSAYCTVRHRQNSRMVQNGILADFDLAFPGRHITPYAAAHGRSDSPSKSR